MVSFRCATGLLLTAIFALASSESCVWHHVDDYGDSYKTYESCSTGCCYSYIYPCCEIYTTVAFKASMAIGVTVLFVGSLVVVIVCRRRRMQQVARPVVVPSVSAHIVNSNTVSNPNAYNPPHMYGVAPPPGMNPYGPAPVNNNYGPGPVNNYGPAPAMGMNKPGQPTGNNYTTSPPAYPGMPPAYEQQQQLQGSAPMH